MPSSVDLWGVPAAAIPRIWPRVAPLVERALPYMDGRYGAEDIRDALSAADMQLWIAGDFQGIGITQLVRYPRKTVCTLILVSGHDFAAWAHHISSIKAWAKAQGADAMDAYGRHGWARRCDWEPLWTVYGKAL